VIPFHTIADQLSHLSLNTIRQLFVNCVALVPFGI
jgi:glycopeptide antibiotics resistance protein